MESLRFERPAAIGHAYIISSPSREEALSTARASVQRGRENLETVREQYQVGDVSRVDYTDAAADYTEALGDRVRAFYRGQIAEAKLFRLAGRMPKYSEEVIVEERK